MVRGHKNNNTKRLYQLPIFISRRGVTKRQNNKQGKDHRKVKRRKKKIESQVRKIGKMKRAGNSFYFISFLKMKLAWNSCVLFSWKSLEKSCWREDLLFRPTLRIVAHQRNSSFLRLIDGTFNLKFTLATPVPSRPQKKKKLNREPSPHVRSMYLLFILCILFFFL